MDMHHGSSTVVGGAQINFRVRANDEIHACCEPIWTIKGVSRDQIEAGSRAGCERCHCVSACIKWGLSQALITSGHKQIRCDYGGNLEFLGIDSSTPNVTLQCWWQSGSAKIYQFPDGTAMPYGYSDIAFSLSNAECSPLPSKTSSRSTFAFIIQQLDDCISTHETCQSSVLEDDAPTDSLQDVRLLELHDTVLKLVSARTSDRYACLSHCWGVDQSFIKTTKANLAIFSTSGIPLASLPKTFRDAVRVCRNLSIAYIWIDCLCIVQDDIDDWSFQAGQMAYVFGNAYLTIAASKSKNSAEGCFGKVKSTYRGQHLPGFSNIIIRHIPPSALNYSWIGTKKRPMEGEQRSVKDYWPLHTRAWVFQEMLLSRRTVCFGVNEVIWQCRTKLKQQSLNVPEYVQVIGSALSRTLMQPKYCTLDTYGHMLSWQKLVSDYCERSLTFVDDRLPAIGAVAKYVSNVRGNDTYLAGLWKSTLVYDLTWVRRYEQSHSVPERQLRHTYIPTWSWAYWSGPVGGWDMLFRDDIQISSTRFLETVHKTVDSPFTGRITEAALLIEAALVQLKGLRSIPDIVGFMIFGINPPKMIDDAFKKGFTNMFEIVYTDPSWDCEFSTQLSTSEVFALPLKHYSVSPGPGAPAWTVTVLLIQQTVISNINSDTQDTLHRQKCYKRVGIAKLMSVGEWIFHHTEGARDSPEAVKARKTYRDYLIEHVEGLETHLVTLV